MYKALVSLPLLALAAVGAPQLWQDRSYLQLKEEVLTLEYASAEGLAVVKLEAEIDEALDRLEIRDPFGTPVLNMRTRGHGFALSGFLIEFEERELSELLESYPEGMYDIRAQTVSGIPVAGRARLLHSLCTPPVIEHPYDGASDVPTDGFTIAWSGDTESIRWKVLMEQDDNDGLSVSLPGDTRSFVVPPGILQPGQMTSLEIIAIDRSGNMTTSEVEFCTN